MMTWEMECHLQAFESAEAEQKHIEEVLAKQAEREAEAQSIIKTAYREDRNDWIASIAGDWRSEVGKSEWEAVGKLWSLYSHEVIAKCREQA